MSDMLPEWAVSQIVNRAGRGLSESDIERIVRSVSESASFTFEQIKNRGIEALSEYDRPSVLYRPSLTIDGNQWCALYGENLQDGVAGFGDSPARAMWEFDKAWAEKLRAPQQSESQEG